MIKDIVYNGITSALNDYECEDGSLDTSMNVEPVDGAFGSTSGPRTVLKLTDVNVRVVYVHQSELFKEHPHYLTVREHQGGFDFGYVTSPDSSVGSVQPTPIETLSGNFTDVTTVGNVVILLTDSGTHYYYWKSDKKGTYSYVHLGEKFPELPLSFSLLGHPLLWSVDENKYDENKQLNFPVELKNGERIHSLNDTIPEQAQSSITSQIFAKLNSFVKHQTVDKGRFCFPFLVRYAFRLYDGRLIGHSAPVLMNPSTTPAPIVFIVNKSTVANNEEVASDSKGMFRFDMDAFMVAADLEYALCRDVKDDSALLAWQDLIKSVDIFISRPMYSYDQEGNIENFHDTDNFRSEFIGKLSSTDVKKFWDKNSIKGPDLAKVETSYAEWTYNDIYTLLGYENLNGHQHYVGHVVHLPEFTSEKQKANMEAESSFFLVKSVKLEDLMKQSAGERVKVEIADDYLQSLVNREPMTDDYRTHDAIRAGTCFSYNSRLHLGDISRKIFCGFSADCMMAYCNCSKVTVSSTGVSFNEDVSACSIDTYIREGGKVYKVTSEGSLPLCSYFSKPRTQPTVQKAASNSSGTSSSETVTADETTSTSSSGLVVSDGGTGSVVADDTVLMKPCDTEWTGHMVFTEEGYSSSSGSGTSGGSSGSGSDSGGTSFGGSNTASGYLRGRSFGAYVYYPNTNAFEMVIRQGGKEYALDLKPHGFLNGAYCLLDYRQARDAMSPTLPTVTDNSNVVRLENRVYTSEVNNPFLFLAGNMTTTGMGRVIGLSTAARALSSGQYGQFPLYAFTSEGVWALEVSGTGTFKARQPITRDVCLSRRTITQIDSSVLFCSQRGIMEISGATCVCISDALSGDSTFSPLSLPMGAQISKLSSCGTSELSVGDFMSYLQGCSMIYDYTKQRIIVYNSAYDYAYVYSIKEKKWGMFASSIAEGVNSYPEALAMSRDGSLLDYSNIRDTSHVIINGVVATRPLKLGMPDVLKTVRTVIQRGVFRKGHVKQALYGSRDLLNWHLIGSSSDQYLRGMSGTPYKYFRVVLICSMAGDEHLVGCSVEFEPRYTDKLR